MQSGKLAFLCSIFALFCAFPFQVGAAGPASHCQADEAVIFSCPADGKNLISVCASKEYSATAGHLQYRYGPAGAPELSLPAKAAPAASARSGLWSFSAGGGAYVRFQDGGTSYYVYTAIGQWGPKGETEEKAGAAVEKDGKVVANIPCRGKETSELGPDFFEKAGLPEVEDEFDLPE